MVMVLMMISLLLYKYWCWRGLLMVVNGLIVVRTFFIVCVNF